MSLRNILIVLLDAAILILGVYFLMNAPTDIQLGFGILFVYLGARALVAEISTTTI